jgi:hypothetical protein
VGLVVRGAYGWIKPAYFFVVVMNSPAPERVTFFVYALSGAFAGSPVRPLKFVGEGQAVS